MDNCWIRTPRHQPSAALQLVCLPHAGGSAGLYRTWAALMPDQVELLLICPPGREARLGAPFPASLQALVGDLAHALRPALTRPWALFGHSMGATVGHELALALEREGHPAPRHLIVSARPAPQDHRGGTVHRRDEAGLCAELRRLGGTAPELFECPELRELVLPAVREDYRLIETYAARPDGLLGCPLTVFVGRDDPELTPDQAEGWRRWTRGRFATTVFPGGHFYLLDQTAAVVAAVLAALREGGGLDSAV